jgi:mono/diheme cytochrome c family protein
MKSNMRLIIGLALLLIGTGGLSTVGGCPMSMGGKGMMQGGMGMMDQGAMKEMMQSMMEDQLPPGIDEADLPEPRSQGARLLARYCVQCHDLPPPALHDSGEWPQVLARMGRRMEMMGRMGSIRNPTEQEQAAILDYLQRHAADASE